MLHQFSQGSRSVFKNFKSWTLISCISGKLTVKCMVQGDMCRKEDCVAPNFSVGRAYLSWKLSIEYPTLIWFWTLIDNNSEKYGTLGSMVPTRSLGQFLSSLIWLEIWSCGLQAKNLAYDWEFHHSIEEFLLGIFVM